MNTEIANFIVSKLTTPTPLNFVDKIAGMVRPMVKVDVIELEDDRQMIVRKVFPVACNVTARQCEEEGMYTDLVPDDKYRTIIYFEDRGSKFIDRARDRMNFISQLRLVCWMNLKHFNTTECSLSAPIIAKIVSSLPTIYENSGNYQNILVEVSGVVPKTQDIFSFYTYKEETNQYLLYPYDYFALDLNVKFSINKNCIEDIEIQTPTC